MARPKKVQEVTIEEVEEGVTVIEVKQSAPKTVLMTRSSDYAEPRTAEVHFEEVEEWAKYGWVKS